MTLIDYFIKFKVNKSLHTEMKTFYCLILFQLFIISTYFDFTSAQNLYINEFMSANNSTIADPDFNSYADWIEIYNAGPAEVNLKDYYITDDLNEPKKFRFTTDLIIQPEEYILIWADDSSTGNHTNFKLSTSGEAIGLFNPVVELIDSYTFSEQQDDISEGRFPDGGTEWVKYFPASPGSANNENNIFNRLDDPVFSLSGGFYQSSVMLNITHTDPEASIYYTIDGSIPSTNDLLYTSPLFFDSTSVISVRAFKENFTPSNTIVKTYFINFNTELPVFSIVTDPDNFFSDTSGIYVIGTNGIPGNCSSQPRNWNQDWERPINLEFYEKDKSPAFNVKTGVKINGGCSRLYPEKSLAFFFRGSYGYGKLNYRLFPDIPITSYNNFILRSSAQDWWRTMFRDGMVQTLIEQGMKISYQEYRPSVLFLNGQYWGIHNIREKLNDHYIESHFGVNINNIDLVEISKGISANNGDLTAYNSMIDFLSTHNMSQQENFEYIKSIVDIDSYIDYQIAEIYGANGDWPGSNMKLWRERTSSGKWRWLIYDLDFTFGGNAEGQYFTNTLEQATATNGPSWPNPPWSTLMLRKLLENSEFKNEFIQRFAVHMNTTFEPEHVNNVIDSLKQIIASEIPRHKGRWEKSISLGQDWDVNIQVMKDFASLRPSAVRSHFNTKFNLTGSYSLIINRNNPDWGKIFTQNVEVKNNNSQNVFFDNIPLKVRAQALPGYRFVRWEGVSNLTSPRIEIINSENSTLTAVFEPDELVVNTLLINEINYNSSSSFDTEDWIELYNPVEENINLTGWKIQDSNNLNVFIFPEGAEIQGREYIVICRDTNAFKLLQPDVENIYGNLDFGLSSDGDMIKLYDHVGNLIDSVSYENNGEWTSLPNGNGPTLSLINPQFDNTIASNWKASGNYGTPGKLNDTFTKVDEEENLSPDNFVLYNNYPNPFNPTTIISWQIPAADKVSLKVYDLLGREVAILVDEFKPAGRYSVEFNATNLSSGIYFYRLQAGKNVETKKLVLMK